MKHAWRCLPFLTCTCCPVCFPEANGRGGNCAKHLAEANQFSRDDGAREDWIYEKMKDRDFDRDPHEVGGIGA